MGTQLRQRVQNNREAQKTGGGLRGDIQKMEQQFQLAMPKGAEATQLIRDALTVLQQNPRLAECDNTSVLGALMTCAQLGLRPGVGALGQAYILPFWNGKRHGYSAQFIIGYQGLIELAHRSGRIESLIAREVHANDTFEVDYGLEDKLVHKPVIIGERGEVIAYYALAKFQGGGHAFIVAGRDEIEHHRDKFATAKKKNGEIFGPWVDDFDAMALKTVLRMLSKYLPKSTNMTQALAADEGLRLDYSPAATPDAATTHETVPGQVVDEQPAGVDTTTGEIASEPTQEEMDAAFAAEAEKAAQR